ncbi:MAG: hypothetical protein KF901_28570, partial [Myxococcales bacterium]|nr:hypothetical protein [Myxococcales bacterium]
ASAANHRVESNERAVVSTLRTTARTHASYGLGQLTVQAHISQAQRLDDRALASLGLSRGELDAMRSRGEAAAAWFRGLVRGAHHPRAIEASGLDRASMVDARMLVQAGDFDTLVERYGDRFSATTGIPADELRALGQTEVLTRDELREAFRAQFAVDHGVEFDPSRRDGAQIIHTVDNLSLTHPELEDVLARLGEGQGSLAAVGHYLGVGDVAENLHGWYARGAQSAVGAPRLDGFLQRLDPLSSGLRNLQNVERALAAVSGVRGLQGADRARVVTRLARCFHGAPSTARQAFFENGDLSRPRFRDVSSLEAALDRYVERRPWSDARVVRAFESLAAERGLA